MKPVRVACPKCLGAGGAWGSDPAFADILLWVRCPLCGGRCRAWADGAPSFGCTITLADRDPGEIITLGNGDRAKIAWHQPRKSRKVVPETTFLLAVDDFTDREDATPVPYPSCIGVLSVDVPRATIDREAHDHEKIEDLNDPVQRTLAGRLL